MNQTKQNRVEIYVVSQNREVILKETRGKDASITAPPFILVYGDLEDIKSRVKLYLKRELGSEPDRLRVIDICDHPSIDKKLPFKLPGSVLVSVVCEYDKCSYDFYRQVDSKDNLEWVSPIGAYLSVGRAICKNRVEKRRMILNELFPKELSQCLVQYSKNMRNKQVRA